MNSVLLFIAAIIVAVLTALIAIPPLIDWNAYRGVFEEEVSRIFGRDVRVRGNVVLRILPQPYLRFEKVRVAEASGVTGEPFLRAESFTIRLSVPPLLRGVIEAKNVALDRPRLRLRVDENGRGSWQQLQFSDGAYVFTPNDVALKAVDIVSGDVTVEGPSGTVLGRVSDVSGQLTAVALRGPYKFIGNLRWQGQEQELRVSTGTLDQNSEVPAKIVVRSGNGQSSVTVDGLVRQTQDGIPRLTGDIVARTVLGSTSAQSRASGADTSRPVEARAKISVDARRFSLDEILVSFDQNGRPQLLAGQAAADLGETPTLNLSLASRWLDLDKLSAEAPGAGPLQVLDALAKRVAGPELALFSRTNIRLRIDQATMAASSISAVTVDATSTAGRLDVQQLAAVLPGGAQLHVDGTLRSGAAVTDAGPDAASSSAAAGSEPTSLRFDGHVLVGGSNAARFAAWFGPGMTEAQVVRAVGFDVRAAVRSRPEAVALSNAAIRIGDARFASTLRYQWGKQRKLALALSGADVDVSSIQPEALDLNKLSRWIGLRSEARARAGEPLELDLRVDAGVLRDSRRVYRNVSVALARKGDAIIISRLRGEDASGLEIWAEGSLPTVAARNAQPARLNGAVTVPSLRARARFRDVLQTVSAIDVGNVLERLPTPASLAFQLSVAPNAEQRLTLGLDGTVRGDRLAMTLRASDVWGRLDDAVVNVSARIDGRSASSILDILTPGRSTRERGTEAQAARLTVIAEGVPSRGIMTNARLVAGRDAIGFEGRVTMDSGRLGSANGQLSVAVPDVRTLARLAQLPMAAQLPQEGFAATAKVEGTLDNLVLNVARARLGKREMSGRLVRTRDGDNVAYSKISGELLVSDLVLPDLLAGLLDPSVNITATGDDERGIAAIWPSARFRPDVLSAFRLDIRVSTASIILSDGLALGASQFRLRADDKGIAVSDLRARGPRGGAVSGTVGFVSDGVGVRLSGRLAAQSVPLTIAPQRAQTAPAGTAASGRADLAVSFSGRGLSPRALVTVLAGSGTVSLINARATELDPAAISAVAATLIVNPELPVDDLPKMLQSAMTDRATLLGSSRHQITIKDGALLVAPIRQTTPGGRVENRTTVDLARLAFDSAWRLALTPPREANGRPLPGVEVIYSGRLANVPGASVRVRADALAREVVVRRLEGNVLELERLRRADEARAAAEAARRRQRGAAPDPDRSPVPAAPSAPQPPALVAPPVLRVPLPLPDGPKQRSQAPSPSARKLALRERKMRQRFGLMRLGTPRGPYDPVPSSDVTTSSAGIVTSSLRVRVTDKHGAIDVPVPVLIGPLTTSSATLPPGQQLIPVPHSGLPGVRLRRARAQSRAARRVQRRSRAARRASRGSWKMRALFPTSN